MPDSWSIIVHGGAKTIRPELHEAHRRGCLDAVEAGRAILADGGTAVEAVAAAIRVLEDNPTFNAGYGSVLNADGEVELDAALMDGATLDVGAVAAVQGVRNPIDLAQRMLRDAPTLLVGKGAYRYAEEQGVALCDPASLIASSQAESCDTVGAVALDQNGDFAAGTSTGGLSDVRPGRVGDSPLPGSGLYAENGIGGVSYSGEGEQISRLALAGRLMTELPQQGAQAAAQRSVKLMMDRLGGEAGCIVIGTDGQPAFAHTSDHFAVAMATSTQEPQAFIQQESQ